MCVNKCRTMSEIKLLVGDKLHTLFFLHLEMVSLKFLQEVLFCLWMSSFTNHALKQYYVIIITLSNTLKWSSITTYRT